MSETPFTLLSATQLCIFFVHRKNAFYSVTWSPDSRMIATGSSDNNIRLWDIASGELVRTLEGHQDWVESVAWSGDGRWLASGAADQAVRVWEASSGQLERFSLGCTVSTDRGQATAPRRAMQEGNAR